MNTLITGHSDNCKGQGESMIHFFNSVKSLKSFLDEFPDDTPVGVSVDKEDVDHGQIEWCYMNQDEKIVGDEAGDYVPKTGEKMILVIS